MRKQSDLGKFGVHLEPDVTNLFNVTSEGIFSNHIVLGLCFADEETQVCKKKKRIVGRPIGKCKI